MRIKQILRDKKNVPYKALGVIEVFLPPSTVWSRFPRQLAITLPTAKFAIMTSSSIGTITAEETKTKCNWRIVEIVLLGVLIIGVWSILSLPILYYHFPRSEVRLYVL